MRPFHSTHTQSVTRNVKEQCNARLGKWNRERGERYGVSSAIALAQQHCENAEKEGGGLKVSDRKYASLSETVTRGNDLMLFVSDLNTAVRFSCHKHKFQENRAKITHPLQHRLHHCVAELIVDLIDWELAVPETPAKP